MHQSDFLIIGSGIFGITAAIELRKRNYTVTVLNPDTVPHHLAASTDISKAVRMEYGADWEYFQMAEICIERWKEWNQFFKKTLYHEVGLLMICPEPIESNRQTFEKYSCENLKKAGYPTKRLDAEGIKKNYPAVSSENFPYVSFNPHAGYAESGWVVETLIEYARQLGISIFENQTVNQLIVKKGQLIGVKTKEGATFSCGHAIVAAGAFTPFLLPELQSYMKPTGHPIFFIRPSRPELFAPPKMAVFMADISNTGWYGFPLHPKLGVVKIGKHTNGLFVHPETGDRLIKDVEIQDLRAFLKKCFPVLANDPIVFTRRCLYTDTLDGHFWIDQHPEIKGLSVSSGGSGHAFKMAPILGEITADMAEGKIHRFSERFKWRHLEQGTTQIEEARYLEGGSLS